MISVFLVLIVSPNNLHALEKLSMAVCNSFIEWATSAQSSANSRSQMVSSDSFVFAVKRLMLNRPPVVRKVIGTPKLLPCRAFCSITAKYSAKSIGARTHPCLVGLVLALEGVNLLLILSWHRL